MILALFTKAFEMTEVEGSSALLRVSIEARFDNFYEEQDELFR